MNFVVADFRKAYPEFTDTVKYPDTLIQGWATLATAMVNPCAWKSQTCLGINLYVAHEITLEAQSVAAANIGGTPGGQAGVVNTKTVGSVTVGYDTQQTQEKNAGWWNLTTYGKQFYRLARIFGAGVVQL
jgi:hypothetical protein